MCRSSNRSPLSNYGRNEKEFVVVSGCMSVQEDPRVLMTRQRLRRDYDVKDRQGKINKLIE